MREEFIAPVWRVEIGSLTFQRVFSIEVKTGLEMVDWATVSFDPRVEERGPFAPGTEAEVHLGYLEKGLWLVFAGKVAEVAWGEEACLHLRGHAEALRKTRLARTFIDATPQEIVAEGVAAAGINHMVLGRRRYVPRHHFVAQNLSVIELIRLVARTWGIDWRWFCDPDGTFYFCSDEEAGRMLAPGYTLEYGVNIFELVPPDAGGRGRLTTVLLPFLRPADRIRIEDKRYWRHTVTAAVESVHHRLDGRLGGRTTLTWIPV